MMAAAGTALVLAGCSGGPEPVEPTAGASPSTSESATPAPTMPAQASEEGPEGVAAFVYYWVEVFNHALASGDSSSLRKVSDPSCAGCIRYSDLFESTYAKNGYFRGGAWKIEKVRLQENPDSSTFTLRVPVAAGRSEFKRDGESQVETANADSFTLVFQVAGEAAERRVQTLEID